MIITTKEKETIFFFTAKQSPLAIQVVLIAKLYFVSTTPLSEESGFLSQVVNSTVVLIRSSLSTNFE